MSNASESMTQVQIRTQISVSLISDRNQKEGANLDVFITAPANWFSNETQDRMRKIVMGYDHTQLKSLSYEDFSSLLWSELLKAFPKIGSLEVQVNAETKFKIVNQI